MEINLFYQKSTDLNISDIQKKKILTAKSRLYLTKKLIELHSLSKLKNKLKYCIGLIWGTLKNTILIL